MNLGKKKKTGDGNSNQEKKYVHHPCSCGLLDGRKETATQSTTRTTTATFPLKQKESFKKPKMQRIMFVGSLQCFVGLMVEWSKAHACVHRLTRLLQLGVRSPVPGTRKWLELCECTFLMLPRSSRIIRRRIGSPWASQTLSSLALVRPT